jgi:CHAT domain-containing protein
LRLATISGDRGFPFLAYQGKARALFALNRVSEAQETLNEALAHAREEQNNFALSQLLVVAGTAEASREPAKSIEYLKEAIEVSRENGFEHVYAWSTWGLAKVYRDTGDLDEAESLASKAIAAMRLLEDRYHLPQHLTLLAGIEAKKGNSDVADELYTEATDLIDALLVNVNTTQLKSSLIATLSEAYVGHFELAATKFSDPGKAYNIIERARGRSLADTLRGETESISSGDQITVDAQKRISSIQLALLHETNRQRRQSLLDTLFAMEQLLRPVQKISSHWNSTADANKPVPLPVLQRSLRPDEMLLEYVLGETQSYCLRLTRTAASVIVLPGGRKRIEGLIDGYLSAIQSRHSEANVGNDLYSLLVRPAMVGNEQNLRLIIVPDGKLHLLPFDALEDDQGQYLLESHIVTYAPSATVLYLLRSSGSSDQATRNFLGIGDVTYTRPMVSKGNATGRQGPRGNELADLFDLKTLNLGDLPGSGEEVISAARILKGDDHLLLGSNATEAAFKSLPVAEFRVLHFAVHGIADPAFPDRAALVLGSSPASGEDGLLQVREIRDLSLHADLVTLSACETGKGKLLGEEGIASLERAFLLAGAKSVIASLWTTDDTYTIALMKRMYQHLVDGYDKGAALRQAKLDLLNDFGGQALPVYWAGASR